MLSSSKTGLAWVVLFPALLVLYPIGEWAFGSLFARKTDDDESSNKVSIKQIGLALLLMLPVFIVAVIAGWEGSNVH
jgi:hypothetical protein